MQYHFILVISLYCRRTFFSVLAFKLIDKISKNVKQLEVVTEILLYAFAEDIVDETEYMLLYDANKSREIYAY